MCNWSAFCLVSWSDQHIVTLCSRYLISEVFSKYFIRISITIEKTKILSNPYSVLNLFILGPFFTGNFNSMDYISSWDICINNINQ
jgi:hypothetical protein